MNEAIKRYLKKSVASYPDPLEWWCHILNATMGNYGTLLEGYNGDICEMHRQIKEG